MTRLNDNVQSPVMEGHFSIYKNGELFLEDKNMILDNASEIMRDLMFGDGNIITKLQFGDLNLTEKDNLKAVPEPNYSDTSMVNKIYEIPVDKRKITKDGYPAIEYTATLESFDLTPNPGDKVLMTEYGLATESGLFAKKNKSAIYKDSEVVFKFIWVIVFRNRSNT